MHDRASVIFLPGEEYEAFAYDGQLVFDRINDAGIVARDDFTFSVCSDTRVILGVNSGNVISST